MADTHLRFRNPAEEAAYKTVENELAARIQRRDHVPEAERDGWRQNMFPFNDRWSSIRELEACVAFRRPSDPASAVIADALTHAGTVSDDLYARLLAVAERRYDRQPATRAVAFDAFGTLVHIGRKRHPYERLIRQARDQAGALPSPMVQPIGLADYAAALGLPCPDAELAALDEELPTIALYPDTLDALRRVREAGLTVAVASNLACPMPPR
ncbi:hypothetical protein [Sphingomonas sp. BAUL-RG-20F-R05-02]|uniref:hypothetical protein n=1 Tax=Sphingomonas sp. BAUL-RG-20F-R05-02 TaxID=2914830 RepID=UPI001F5790BC|nr:hypothetical protein [Sphingomonas sp. BAUL-RG-20F-R05-02]